MRLFTSCHEVLMDKTGCQVLVSSVSHPCFLLMILVPFVLSGHDLQHTLGCMQLSVKWVEGESAP